MRKTVTATGTVPAREWLDLEFIASVEVTTEDPAFPIENALKPVPEGAGWRAGAPGEQKITILFDGPTLVRLIHLEFSETEMSRTQEFTLHWQDAEGNRHEIVRQQWNFSPSGSSREVEDFRPNLAGMKALELTIRPDLSNSSTAVASLAQMRLA